MRKAFYAAALIAAFALTLACKPASTSTPATGGTGAKPAKANPVIVVLNVERIMHESKLSKDIQADLKSWAEGIQGQLQSHAEVIRKAEADKSKSPKELDAMKSELFQMQQQAKNEFQQRQEAAADQMKKAFDPLVQRLAKENGWDVVLNENEQITIFASNALDQTDFVIQQLNAAPAPSPAPAPETPKS